MNRRLLFRLFLILCALLAGCAPETPAPPPDKTAIAALVIATTSAQTAEARRTQTPSAADASAALTPGAQSTKGVLPPPPETASGLPAGTSVIFQMFNGQQSDPVTHRPVSGFYRLDSDGRLYLLQGQDVQSAQDGFEVSPDGQWIAFTMDTDGGSQYDLFKMRVDGSGLINMTHTAQIKEEAPHWSPDGQTILYTGLEKNGSQLYQMPVNGSSPTALSLSAGVPREVAFSPDGKWLTYTAYTGDSSYTAFIATASGQAPKQLLENEPQTHLARWSPDSRQIAFARFENGWDQTYIYNLETKQAARLALPQALVWSTPDAYSPDGRTLILAGQESGKHVDVYAYDLASGALRSLTGQQRLSMSFLAWSPDGQKMLLAAWLNGPARAMSVLDWTTGQIRLLDGLPTPATAIDLAYIWNRRAMPSGSDTAAENIHMAALPEPIKLTGQEPTVQVNADQLNVRSGPSTVYPIVGQIKLGETVTVLGKSPQEEWLQIAFEGTLNGTAWVYAKYLDLDLTKTELPSIAAKDLPPTPVP